MKLYIGIFIAGTFVGFAAHYHLTRPKPVVEVNAPEMRQTDGSLVLERATIPVKIPHKLPGGKPVRHQSVTVAPKQPERPLDGTCPVCPDVRVDLTTVEAPDGSRRVVASSPDGTVVGGVDVPLETRNVSKPTKWSAGGYYSPINNGYGGFLTRDVGPFVVGGQAGVADTRDGAGDRKKTVDVRIQFGLRF